MRELQNTDRTVVYQGEALVSEEGCELNGQGKLETFGYEGRYDLFSGRFICNVRHGQATLIKKNAEGKALLEFEGVFWEDMPEGQGQLTLLNEAKRVFQGQFKDGLMEGFGQVECKGKFTYSGQWHQGKPHGQGQCVYSELDLVYTGMWENGVKCGQGEIIYQKTGYKMRGNFKDDMLDGEGTRTFAGGKTLSGIWSEGHLVTGKMVNVDGTTYDGDWVGGRPHGTGVKVISGGKRYEGMFSVGRPWGKGAKVSGEARTEGYWDRAKFVEGAAAEEKVAEFNEQLQSIRTYYKVFKKFHAKELPRTNYDCNKEEAAELDGLCELELLERVSNECSA